jgi:hypothetical protein
MHCSIRNAAKQHPELLLVGWLHPTIQTTTTASCSGTASFIFASCCLQQAAKLLFNSKFNLREENKFIFF